MVTATLHGDSYMMWQLNGDRGIMWLWQLYGDKYTVTVSYMVTITQWLWQLHADDYTVTVTVTWWQRHSDCDSYMV